MSRASAVRDAVAVELQTRFPAETVETFWIPDYTLEELREQRRIGVRIGGRNIEVDQGPDTRGVLIDVGVIGAVSEKEGISLSDYRTQVVQACDGFDALLESIIALWTPNGQLAGRQAGMAEHRFLEIEQPAAFDPKQLYDSHTYISMIRLTYVDSQDT